MRKIANLFILILIITSCQQNEPNYALSDIASYQNEAVPMTKQSRISENLPNQAIKTDEINKKKIIKDGRLGVKVSELEKAKKWIDTLVINYGGYYANEEFNNTDYETSYQLNIRIPSNRFEKFIIAIETGEGEIIYKKIDARDVTDQFIDLETRLKNKKNYLIKYGELLEKAKTVKDILEIEEKIRILEEEIESVEGRLNYLNDLVAYSTLDLRLTKDKDFKFKSDKRAKFTEKLKQSLSKGWFGFVDFILFVIKIWPFWIVLFIVNSVWKKIRTKKKNKK